MIALPLLCMRTRCQCIAVDIPFNHQIKISNLVHVQCMYDSTVPYHQYFRLSGIHLKLTPTIINMPHLRPVHDQLAAVCLVALTLHHGVAPSLKIKEVFVAYWSIEACRDRILV